MSFVSCVGGTLSCEQLCAERPPVVTYTPCMWAHTFSNISIDEQVQQKYGETIEALKQEARGMLMAATTPLKQMILIDTLERLVLAYHFETEIEQTLANIYNIEGDGDLFYTALRFRLLRQHQFHIPCTVFGKFVDKDGKFEETLISRDGEGLLSLYEAAHVRFRDEKILEDAAKFTKHHLSCMTAELESPFKERVKRALEHPLHRDVPIFHARFYISIYEQDYSRDELLLKLAKFNFNFLQNLYKQELRQLFRWWNKYDLKSKLPHTRDRVVEAYIWGVGYHYEPRYSYVRTGIAKVLQVITMMDDTYDNYATLDEAQLFTEMLDRWNMDGIDRLPNDMKIVYHFIMSAFEDYERDAAKQGLQLAVPYYKETVQELGRAYNQELKWLMGRKMPSFQDYAKNSEITSNLYNLFAGSNLGLKYITQETIDWIKSEPKFATSAAMLGRYCNDIASSERENKEGKMMTVLDCYMNQYNLSKKETLSKFAESYEEKWMDVNEEWVATSFVPKETTIQILNYARLCDVCYVKSNGDGYTNPKVFAAHVAAIFIDPIVI